MNQIEKLKTEAEVWRKRAREASRQIAYLKDLADEADGIQSDELLSALLDGPNSGDEDDLEALALGNYRYR